MKKAQFPAKHFDYSTNAPKLTFQTGYTDGEYNFYRSKETRVWFAVHPDNGMAAASGPTLKTCQKNLSDAVQSGKIAAALRSEKGKAMNAEWDRMKQQYGLI